MANDKKDDRKSETPEDVAALYAWANMQNVKYRDFSADRREFRAQQQMQRPTVARPETRAEAPTPVKPAAQARPAPRRMPSIPGQLGDPYSAPERRSLEDSKRPTSFAQMPSTRMDTNRESGVTRLNLDAARPIAVPAAPLAEERLAMEESGNIVRPVSRNYPTAPALPRVPMPIPAQPSAQSAPQVEQFVPPARSAYTQPFSTPQATSAPVWPPEPAPIAQASSWQYSDPTPEENSSEPEATESMIENDFATPADRPAWLYQEPPVRQAQTQPHATPDTLIDTRERVASRWFALRGVFNTADEGSTRPQEFRTPVTAVFSLAGGVGKTSMVATLGRALSAAGEHVLLADTTSYGLLPFYYGARELRPGVVRTFNPPPSTSDSPVNMVSFETDVQPAEDEQDKVLTQLAEAGRSSNRVLVDLATASSTMAKRILRMGPTVIVPIVPDMSSVIGLAAVEQFFRNHRSGNGQVVQPSYLLNQFDASQPLHLDVREVLRQQLGERLLPIVLRRSQAVSEALAEGMTVMDYAPKSGIADDYAALANWLRSVHAPSQQAFRAMRWSEQ